PNTPGNLAMLDAFHLHSAPNSETRSKAPPLILFRRVAHSGRTKGHVEFEGLALIERVELVTQADIRSRRPFVNYGFDLLIIGLAAEAEEFSWDWITRRRDPSATDDDCLTLAPSSWRTWVAGGESTLSRVRRSAARPANATRAEQLPEVGTREYAALDDVLRFYAGRNHRFEALAELIAAEVLRYEADVYRIGLISPRGHDFGIDFVGRLD